MLRDSAQAFLSVEAPVTAMRRLRDSEDATGFDPELWQRMVEMGWSGMLLPEHWGGLDFGFKGIGALFEQCGRHLTPSPLLATVVLGGGLLLRAGSQAQCQRWLPLLAEGKAWFALALEELPRHDPRQVACSATRTATGWQLDGEKWLVLDGHIAQQLIVVARTSGLPGQEHGLSLFLLDPATAGVQLSRSRMIDSRNAARLQLSAVQIPADALLGALDGGFEPLDAVLDQARVCLAAEGLGLLREVFERTLGYLKQRVQFDVVIGSFQALQHRAARLHVELEQSQSAVAAALAALQDDPVQAAQLASLAKAKVSKLSELLLNEAVQLHGGIGVTDELDIGLFLKRGRVIQQTFGDAVFHNDRYARLNGF